VTVAYLAALRRVDGIEAGSDAAHAEPGQEATGK
jgi:hypothetical protein